MTKKETQALRELATAKWQAAHYAATAAKLRPMATYRDERGNDVITPQCFPLKPEQNGKRPKRRIVTNLEYLRDTVRLYCPRTPGITWLGHKIAGKSQRFVDEGTLAALRYKAWLEKPTWVREFYSGGEV